MLLSPFRALIGDSSNVIAFLSPVCGRLWSFWDFQWSPYRPCCHGVSFQLVTRSSWVKGSIFQLLATFLAFSRFIFKLESLKFFLQLLTMVAFWASGQMLQSRVLSWGIKISVAVGPWSECLATASRWTCSLRSQSLFLNLAFLWLTAVTRFLESGAASYLVVLVITDKTPFYEVGVT